jgi:hypothetical protein
MEPMDANRASCMEMIDPALMAFKSGAQFQISVCIFVNLSRQWC